MWRYSIRSRKITENGVEAGIGHSGWGEYANDPTKCNVKKLGPLPPGKYRFGPAYKHDHLGPITMNLEPLPGTDTFGRSLFRIHGDNRTPEPFDASHGCLIAPRDVRMKMIHARDRILEVTE
jgi:hypothetical protein